jgi:hypothetical protein
VGSAQGIDIRRCRRGPGDRDEVHVAGARPVVVQRDRTDQVETLDETRRLPVDQPEIGVN